MRIIDDALLDEFRTRGRCEMCGKMCRVREPDHYMAEGHGGGNKMDVRCNVVGVGAMRTFECLCHRKRHDGNLPRAEILAVIAKREGVAEESVLDVLWLIKRLPKEAPPWRIELDVEAIASDESKALARRELKKFLEAT